MSEINHDELCWICNTQIADSHEHKLLKSLLSFLNGGSQFEAAPNQMHLLSHDNHPSKLNGVNADALKFRSRICKLCNNNETQSADTCFALFIKYIAINFKSIIQAESLNLNSVTKKSSHSSLWATGIRQHITKQFGCTIKDNNWSVPKTFGTYILSKQKNCPIKISICFNEDVLLFPAYWHFFSRGHLIGHIDSHESYYWHFQIGPLRIYCEYGLNQTYSQGAEWLDQSLSIPLVKQSFLSQKEKNILKYDNIFLPHDQLLGLINRDHNIPHTPLYFSK